MVSFSRRFLGLAGCYLGGVLVGIGVVLPDRNIGRILSTVGGVLFILIAWPPPPPIPQAPDPRSIRSRNE